MKKTLPIPEQEQFQALASGLKEVYSLLTEYLGDLNNAPDFRQYITVSRAQLAGYLRCHPELAERHISKPSSSRYHESPVLERTGGKFLVYEIDHGRPWNMKEFMDMADATAEYLMWGW